MSSVSRPPRSSALAGAVTSFWVSVRPDAGSDEVVLPNGRAQLVVDGDHGVALLVGPRTRPATVSSSTFAAGMSLSGAGLRALSRIPVPELVDVAVDADVVIERGRWVQCLEESDPAAILDRLEHEALRHVRGDGGLSQQVARGRESDPEMGVESTKSSRLLVLTVVDSSQPFATQSGSPRSTTSASSGSNERFVRCGCRPHRRWWRSPRPVVTPTRPT